MDKNSLDEIFRGYIIDSEVSLLTMVTNDLNDFENQSLIEVLKAGYSSSSPNVRIVTSLFNSLFTHRFQTFILSKRTMSELLKKDKHLKNSTLNTNTYKLLIYSMLSKTNQFQRLREPVSFKGAVYKLIEPNLLEVLHQLHSKDWFEMQEQKVLNFYDQYMPEQVSKRKRKFSDFLKEKEKVEVSDEKER